MQFVCIAPPPLNLIYKNNNVKATNNKNDKLALGNVCNAFLCNHRQLHGPSGSFSYMERLYLSRVSLER